MYFRFLLLAFLLYLLYRLVFHFIIPIYKTTRQVKSQFKDMQHRMQEEMNKSSFAKASEDKQAGFSKNSTSKEQRDDYIDFEEVK